MNYFTLFQIPVAFALDKDQLKHTLFALQKQYHPDVAKDKKQPVSADVLNFAYDVLVNDDKRALYLLQLQGVDVNLDTTIDDRAFLQQIKKKRKKNKKKR